MSANARVMLGVLGTLAVGAALWFAFVAPKRAAVAEVQAQIGQAQSRRDVALSALRNVEQARADYRRDRKTVKQLVKAVPTDDDVDSLLKQLDRLAHANRVDFRAVKLTAGSAGAPQAESAPAAEGESGAKTDDTAAAPADSKTAAPAAVAQPLPGTIVGPAGLLTVPFSFTFDGGYADLQRLLKAMHEAARRDSSGTFKITGRLLTVDGFALVAGRGGFPKLKAIVSATAYVEPAR
jgi:hypothetical protein